jgi:cell division protein FtsB
VNLRRVIITFYLLLFLTVAAAASVFFLQTRREYRQLLKSEAESKRLLAEAQLKLREQQRILDRLRSDPAFVEMVIRRRLGYAKPDEMIFRFESTGDRDLRHEEGARGGKRAP